MLNSFQHPLRLIDRTEQAEKWTLKQVQGDGYDAEAEIMLSKRSLLNALQKSQIDAIQLLRKEQEHHALCLRSIHSYPHYTELLIARLRSVSDRMDAREKQILAQNLEWTQINLDSVKNEISAGFQSLTRRTVIVLADIIENIVEATIGLCLLHLDPERASVREVTSFKREIDTEQDLKKAVRAWERKLYSQLRARTERFDHMLRAFFPDFKPPDEFETIDRMIVDRNRFTHEMIRLDDDTSSNQTNIWTLDEVDDAFRVAHDFLLAIMFAIPGDLEAPTFRQS